MKIKTLAVSIALTTIIASTSFAASIEKAAMLNKYGLSKEAKVELINVVFSKSSDSSKIKSQSCCKFISRQVRSFHLMLRTLVWYFCLASRHSWNSVMSK